MKTIFSTFIIVLFCYHGYSQQNMGSVEVNKNFTATLSFGSEIELITIGGNPQIGKTPDGVPRYQYYDIYQSGSTAIISTRDALSPKGSITVKLISGTIYYGTISYGDKAQIFYPFTQVEEKHKQEVIHKDSVLEAKVEESIINKMNTVLELESEDVEGILENLLEVVVSNIRNDDKYTYFKICIKNYSGNDYIIDNTTFKYIEGKNKGLFKKGSKIEERERIVYETDNKTVKANTVSELGYVIPLFAVGTSGNLKIQFVEKKGTRNPSIEISSKTMLKVKVISN